MKKLVSLFLSAALMGSMAALCTSCNNEGEDGAQDIIVHTNAYFAPFEYYDGTEIVGVDVDIMKKVGEKLGRNVQFENTEFSVIIDNVAAGKLCDAGAAGITITDARKEKVDFSTPYYTSVQYVIYKNGTMQIDGTAEDGTDYILWDSLAGKSIGVQRDTTGDIYVSDEINAQEGVDGYDYTGVLNGTGAQVSQFDDAQLAVDAIGANKIDVVVVDHLPASYIVDKNTDYACAALYYKGAEGEPDTPTQEEYAIAVTKGNTELLGAINEVLVEMMQVDEATGENQIQQLVKQHMGLTD